MLWKCRWRWDSVKLQKSYKAPDKRGLGLRIIQRYFFLFLNKNICCDPSLEPSQQGGSDDG